MPNFVPNRIVKVTWEDAWHNEGGEYLPSEFEVYCAPVISVSVGTVLWENERGILLSRLYEMKRFESSVFNRSLATEFIQRGMIMKVEELILKGGA